MLPYPPGQIFGQFVGKAGQWEAPATFGPTIYGAVVIEVFLATPRDEHTLKRRDVVPGFKKNICCLKKYDFAYFFNVKV